MKKISKGMKEKEKRMAIAYADDTYYHQQIK